MKGKSDAAPFLWRKSATNAPNMKEKSTGLSREGKKGRNNLKSTQFSRENFRDYAKG